MWRKVREDSKSNVLAEVYQNEADPELLVVWRDDERQIAGFELPLGIGLSGPYILRYLNGAYTYGDVDDVGMMAPVIKPTRTEYNLGNIVRKFRNDARRIDRKTRKYILEKINLYSKGIPKT
jgi:hypothetical protein